MHIQRQKTLTSELENEKQQKQQHATQTYVAHRQIGTPAYWLQYNTKMKKKNTKTRKN